MRALSFGQMRRVLIARALVRKPRILVLDEFTNGLDRDARREILALLDDARAGGAADLRLAPRRRLHRGRHPPRDHARRPDRRTRHRPAARARARRAPRRARAARAGRAPATPPIVDDPRRRASIAARRWCSTHVDWSIAPGEHTAIFGANGSGKSTFAGLVAGTLAPDCRGEVRRFGRTGPFDLWRVKERIVHVSDDCRSLYTVNETVERRDPLRASHRASGCGTSPTPRERATRGDIDRAARARAAARPAFMRTLVRRAPQGADRAQPRAAAGAVHPRRGLERARRAASARCSERCSRQLAARRDDAAADRAPRRRPARPDRAALRARRRAPCIGRAEAQRHAR